nr:hypothetical protein [Sphingomonas sp. Ag1]
MVDQLLAEERHVLGISRQAIERIADDRVDHARFDVAQEPLEGGPVPAIARLFRIEIGFNHSTAEVVDELHARRGLISTRRGRLHGRGMTTI